MTPQDIEQAAKEYSENKVPLSEDTLLRHVQRLALNVGFLAGATHVKEEPKWVSVEEKMPDDNEVDVMVVGGNDLSITIMRGSYIHYIFKNKGTTTLFPAYWHPLPPLPHPPAKQKDMKAAEQTVESFIGEKATYDSEGQKIWGNKGKHVQMIADLRGWGAIQNLFKDKGGSIDMEKAENFQDKLGHWIADAINEKLEGNTMKQFAAEQSQEFAEWVDESGYIDSSDYDPKNEVPKMWQLINQSPPPFHGTLDCESEKWETMIGEKLTTAEFYDLFLKEKNNS